MLSICPTTSPSVSILFDKHGRHLRSMVLVVRLLDRVNHSCTQASELSARVRTFYKVAILYSGIYTTKTPSLRRLVCASVRHRVT